jgi:hypothetical protein
MITKLFWFSLFIVSKSETGFVQYTKWYSLNFFLPKIISEILCKQFIFIIFSTNRKKKFIHLRSHCCWSFLVENTFQSYNRPVFAVYRKMLIWVNLRLFISAPQLHHWKQHSSSSFCNIHSYVSSDCLIFLNKIIYQSICK